jgi:hypothetical protein
MDAWISWFGAGLIALALIVAPPSSRVHAVGDAHKVSVVSFGLFGDQGVFRSEATGAAQVVAGRFGGSPINVQYNSKKGAGATIQGLAMALQAAANGRHPQRQPNVQHCRRLDSFFSIAQLPLSGALAPDAFVFFGAGLLLRHKFSARSASLWSSASGPSFWSAAVSVS